MSYGSTSVGKGGGGEICAEDRKVSSSNSISSGFRSVGGFSPKHEISGFDYLTLSVIMGVYDWLLPLGYPGSRTYSTVVKKIIQLSIT